MISQLKTVKISSLKKNQQLVNRFVSWKLSVTIPIFRNWEIGFTGKDWQTKLCYVN